MPGTAMSCQRGVVGDPDKDSDPGLRAPGSRAWLLVSRSRDSSSVLQPCFANVLAYVRFDDLLASLRVNN